MATQANECTVMLLDDHPLLRQGLRRIIEESGRFKVVAEAASGYEAIHLAEVHHPRLILSDIQLPGVTGLKIARVLKKQAPRTDIIMLSMHLDDEWLLEAVHSGASAYITKDIDARDLLEVLARVLDGEQPIYQQILSRPQLAWKVLTEMRSLGDEGTPTTKRTMPLSVREIEVLDCVAQGHSNKEVAEALFITEQTVKNHMTSVLRKLDVEDRVQAVLYAVKHGWVSIGVPHGIAAA